MLKGPLLYSVCAIWSIFFKAPTHVNVLLPAILPVMITKTEQLAFLLPTPIVSVYAVIVTQ